MRVVNVLLDVVGGSTFNLGEGGRWGLHEVPQTTAYCIFQGREGKRIKGLRERRRGGKITMVVLCNRSGQRRHFALTKCLLECFMAAVTNTLNKSQGHTEPEQKQTNRAVILRLDLVTFSLLHFCSLEFGKV